MKSFKALLPDSGWPERRTFSPAVQVGNFVFLSGSTAGDADGNIVGAGDIAAQTRYIFTKFETILRPLGGDLRNIIETTDYVLSLEEYARTADVRREMLGGPPWPAATGVVVSGLVRPGALIEIKAIAAL